MARNEQVTRRVVRGRNYKVLSVNLKEGKVEDLGIIFSATKLDEVEVAKQNGVDKVVIEALEVVTDYYSVPVDKFMEMANISETKRVSLVAESGSEEAGE